MNRELKEDRTDDVDVEDGSEGTLLREFVDRLCECETKKSVKRRGIEGKEGQETHPSARDAHEAHAHEHASDRDLVVTELDTLEVLHRKRPRRDEAVEGEDLVHLNRRHEGATTLTDDVRDWRRRRRSAGREEEEIERETHWQRRWRASR